MARSRVPLPRLPFHENELWKNRIATFLPPPKKKISPIFTDFYAIVKTELKQ